MVSAAQSPGRRGSVLIADNEPSVLLSTKRILEEDGWDVHTADSSGGILEAVRDNGFDLILVDHKMPGNENLQLVRVLGEEYPGCPVIVVTGYPSLPSALQSFRMQVFDYLPKPFDIGFLRQRVAEAVERGRLLRALAESESTNRALLNAIPDLMVRISSDGTCLEAHGNEEEFLFSAERFVGWKIFDVLPKEAAEATMDALQETLESGCVQTFEYQMSVKGWQRDFEARLAPCGAEEVLGIIRDITDRKQTEKALRRSEERLRHILQNTPAGYCCTDAEGRIQSVNPAWLRMHGYDSEQEILGRDLSEAIFPEDRPKAGRLFERLKSGEPVPGEEVRVLRKEGSPVCVMLSATPVFIGEKIIGVEAFLIDCSGRKTAEEALRESEEKYRFFVNNAVEGVYRAEFRDPIPVDLPPEEQIARILSSSFIAECNAAAAALLGHESSEDALGQGMHGFLDLSSPQQLEALCAFVQGGYRLRKCEFRQKIRDGSIRDFVSSHVGCVEGGKLHHVWGTLLDVTEQKLAEKALRKAARMEATATMAGGVAHGFNNLMTSVLGYAELLKEDLADNPNLVWMLNEITQAAQRAAGITMQILEFAQGAKGCPAIINMNEIIEETVSQEERSLPPAVSVYLDLDPHLPAIAADPARMRQVLVNLLANAREALKDGGRILVRSNHFDISEDNTPVLQQLLAAGMTGSHDTAVYLAKGRYVCVSVEDTGCGMDHEAQAKAFEPFFSTKFMGRGLGLAVTHGIVYKHNGHISLYSEKGIGTVCNVFFRAAEAPKETVARPEPGGALPRGVETILVIDDDPAVRDVARKALERLGYTVLTASDGLEAAEILRDPDGPVHLALLDIGMPALAGDKALPLLKEIRPDLKIIICSGYDLNEGMNDLLEAGVQGFLAKPFGTQALATQVRKVLDS